jgi:hypothetical protein
MSSDSYAHLALAALRLHLHARLHDDLASLAITNAIDRHQAFEAHMQYGPRGAPLTGVLRQLARPAASSAAATVSPARACAGAPSIVIGTAGAEAASGSRWNMESPC